MPNPAYQAPKNPLIWTNYWHRAAAEEIGIAIHCDGANTVYQYLHQSRPPGFEDFTLARGPDPSDLYIIKPGVTLDV